MKMKAVIVVLLMNISCAATQTYPAANKVRLTNTEPTNCEFLGDVTGGQGGFLGGLTSNNNLETGARNDLKNKAFEMGGNTVYLLTNRAGQTGNAYGSSQQTNVTLGGNVYRCPTTVVETSTAEVPAPAVESIPAAESAVETQEVAPQ